jgi:Family of unknown function (DUF5677)
MKLWLPETKANELILNRAQAEADVDTHLRPHLTALSEMVDYGTHLIPRCWHSSGRSIRDMVVLIVLLKQVVALLDAGTELLRKGCVQPALLQLRAAFEASVYIDWILASRRKTRAKAYYVWNVRRQLRWIKRSLKGPPEAKALKKETKGLRVQNIPSTPENQRSWREEAKRLQSHLNSPTYCAWNARFEKRRGKKLYDLAWYDVLFTRKRNVSFYEICRRVRRLAEYRFIYEIGSEVMHSSRSDVHLQILDRGQFTPRPLRDLTEFGFVCRMLMTLVVYTYRRILQEYRPDEMPRFAQKYVENWRKAMRTQIKVTYVAAAESMTAWVIGQ